jgi:hypothetical protein
MVGWTVQCPLAMLATSYQAVSSQVLSFDFISSIFARGMSDHRKMGLPHRPNWPKISADKGSEDRRHANGPRLTEITPSGSVSTEGNQFRLFKNRFRIQNGTD